MIYNSHPRQEIALSQCVLGTLLKMLSFARATIVGTVRSATFDSVFQRSEVVHFLALLLVLRSSVLKCSLECSSRCPLSSDPGLVQVSFYVARGFNSPCDIPLVAHFSTALCAQVDEELRVFKYTNAEMELEGELEEFSSFTALE